MKNCNPQSSLLSPIPFGRFPLEHLYLFVVFVLFIVVFVDLANDGSFLWEVYVVLVLGLHTTNASTGVIENIWLQNNFFPI